MANEGNRGSPSDDRARLTSDDVQTLENVLDDTPTTPRTRSWLLGRAATAAGAAGVAGAGFPLARAFAQGTADSAKKVGTTAVTAEALAVTYLTNLIQKTGAKFPKTVQEILKAANAAEQDHYKFLRGAGFKPLTTKFWIPDAAFAAANAPGAIERLETIFVNAYLIGTTTFARAKNETLARYAAEIAGVEAMHRTLARDLQGKLPDNLAFERYEVKSLDAIVKEIAALGIGLGKQGKQPGAFYTYSSPPASVQVALAIDAPDQTIPFPLPTPSGRPVMTG